jgi:predicted Zn finger-like uncharacterized protein
MALATKCPHCATTFRVAADQLKLRGGIVRCGSCQHIFDGNASLVDLDARTAALPDDEVHAAPPGPQSETRSEPEPEEIPVYEIDLASTLDPLGILPHPETDSHPEPHPAASEPASDPEDIEVIDLAGQPDLLDESQDAPAEPPAAEPPEDETIPAAELEQAPAEAPAVEVAGGDAIAGLDEETPVVMDVIDDPVVALDEETPVVVDAIGDTTAALDEEAPPAAQAANGHKAVFSMGSALLSEPGQPRASREAHAEPTFDLPVDEELVAAPPPVDRDEPLEALHAQADNLARYAGEHSPLPLREAAESHFSGTHPAPPAAPAKPRSRLGRRSKLTPTKIAPPKLRVPEIDEPEFVKRGRQQERSGKRRRILMAAGSVVLAFALVAQAAATFRNDLAARYPGMRPALAAVCSLLGCRVELPARIENLTIETGDLQTLENKTYMLTTLLHNQAGLAQAWPAIELALTDANDKQLLRRVFTPAEYLPKGVAPAAGFGPHAEQPIKLYFQLDQLTPSGYHIAVFYP